MHADKRYKIETLFTAVYIFDEFLTAIGYKNFQRESLCLLAVTSLLLAAKTDEAIHPNFYRMIKLLTNQERKRVSNTNVCQMEVEILSILGFDMNFPNPIQAMERYLRLLDFDIKPVVNEMAFQLSKFVLNDSKFLDYRPS